jgi:transcription-repair coupling factor (superfamily II helicase)
LSKSKILSTYSNSPQVQQLAIELHNRDTKINAKGLIGSSLSFVVQSVFEKTELPMLLLFNDKEEAAYHLNDLEQLINDQDVLFYPGSYRRPYQIDDIDNANVLLRAEVLNRINSRKKPAIIVSYAEALFEKVVTRKELEKNTFKIAVSDKLAIDFINEVLFEYNFKRVDFVTEPGEFSVRGGIVDVFSFSNDNPYRIEFFGNEVDSIRSFDVETQLSVERLKKIAIIPNVENKFLSLIHI